MEEYTTLHNLLDSLCASKTLKSWTVHENLTMTTCTLRFCSPSGVRANEADTKTTAFKRKSRTQLDRDKRRIEQHFEKPNTRSRSKGENSVDIENERLGDSELTFPGGACLSPETVHAVDHTLADPESSLLRMDAHVNSQSPGSRSFPGSPTMTESSAFTYEDDTHKQSIELPVMPSVTDTSSVIDLKHIGGDIPIVTPNLDNDSKSHSSTNNPRLDAWLSNLPKYINTPLFRKHFSKQKITWAAMHCNDCRTNVNKAAAENRRMAYCAHCDLYFCDSCLEKEKLCFCDYSPVYIT